MIEATINSRQYQFEPGISVLDACRSAGVEIPTLCDDERLKAIGSCRMCLVEVDGKPRPVPACNNLVSDGMAISTHTPALENQRRMVLRMLAQDHPGEDLQESATKPLYEQALRYGLSESDFNGSYQPHLVDDSHPYIHVDMSKCITCYRCVRICEEIQGQFVWQVINRGHETRIVPDSGTTLGESSCVSCGACVDTCPSGALEDKSTLDRQNPTKWTRTTCPYCGTGCELNVGTDQNRLVTIKPVLDAPANRGHICVKGRYAFDFVDAADRITVPLFRTNDGARPLSGDEAVSHTATRLQQIAKEHGPNSVGVLGSARATNEENYLTQKFARVVIGTNNVDCCARVCHTPTAAAMKLMLGTGAATNAYNDIEKAQTILVCGANATANHPIVGARIKQAALKGAKLIVIDPRQIELARYADVHLRLKPGTNIPLLNAMACTIVEERLVDYHFASERVAEWDEFCEFIQAFTPEKAATICGVEADLIRQAARLYAMTKPAICFHGLGVTEHTQGTEGVMCLVNLALLTGNVGKPGAGINPLRGQNNVQGAAHMGSDPNYFTGYAPISDAATRLKVETFYGVKLPKERGLDAVQIVEAAEKGNLDVLWAIGYDIMQSHADIVRTQKVLETVPLVVVQDLFMNETARAIGTVFLPAAASFEKDGTFMNSERRIQRVRKAVEPQGEAVADWVPVCEVAKRMGMKGFDFKDAEEIWNEVRSLWPAGAGISYAKMEREGGIQGPCPDE